MKNPILFLLVVAILLSCRSRQTSSGTTQAQQATKPVQIPDDFPAYELADFFDATGYYSPSDSVRYEDFILKWFGLSAQCYESGKAIYNDAKHPSPSIALSYVYRDSRKTVWLHSDRALATRDTLYFKVSIPDQRTLEIAGQFVDKRGQYWNQSDVIPDTTIVAKASVRIFADQAIVFDKQCTFTYLAGD